MIDPNHMGIPMLKDWKNRSMQVTREQMLDLASTLAKVAGGTEDGHRALMTPTLDDLPESDWHLYRELLERGIRSYQRERAASA
jgi:hypothetical protein